ncbi:hypothetical protein [Ramlibacter sp. AN1133]|uniref:hypothetical protein n=1 Tax=Ramlibacter sp. AN1133 TaxID=3133429 RepID=UPI0030C0540B
MTDPNATCTLATTLPDRAPGQSSTSQAGDARRLAYLAGLTPEAMLHELLAVMHGDGGHYCAAHGLAKAVADAESKWHALASASTPLEPVVGDVLPPVNSRVWAHYARPNEWREQTVVGYYVWPDLSGSSRVHRVFLRLRDDEGWPSARMLLDVQRVPGNKEEPHA